MAGQDLQSASSPPIEAATLLSVDPWRNSKSLEDSEFWIVEAKFLVPLVAESIDQGQVFQGLSLVLNAKIVLGTRKEQRNLDKGSLPGVILSEKGSRITAFLCGGPGEENPPDRNPDFNHWALGSNSDQCIIFVDYRGTGKSVEIRDSDNNIDPTYERYMKLVWLRDHSRNDDTLSEDEVIEFANLLRNFGQDSIVRDLEAIRQCLLPKSKWDLFGQSFGGWVVISYLSWYPEGLERATITAGVPPKQRTPDEVYSALFEVVKAKNDEYYTEYAEDIPKVKNIVSYLLHQTTALKLPSGGYLSARRFLCIGRNLGTRSRWADLHTLIGNMEKDIRTPLRGLTKESLREYEDIESWKLDRRPLYYVLHEAMYCRQRGDVINWSAERVAEKFPEFAWAAKGDSWKKNLTDLCGTDHGQKIYFSGEMVYPFMADDYKSLIPLREVADRLAQQEWSMQPYGALIEKNKVKVAAIIYDGDMHVHTRFSEEVAGFCPWLLVKAMKMPLNKEPLEHASLRTRALEILEMADQMHLKMQ